jgi:hypothetical protein
VLPHGPCGANVVLHVQYAFGASRCQVKLDKVKVRGR